MGHKYTITDLDADADRAMPHVGPPRLRHGVVVDVDDLVEVAGDDLGHLAQPLMAEDPPPRSLLHKHGQADRGQVAHRHLVGRRVLDDLGAQVGALDGAEVLLVALAVARVLPLLAVSSRNYREEDKASDCPQPAKSQICRRSVLSS